MTQLNAPYASGPYLSGFLRQNGVECALADASLELALRLFSRKGLSGIAEALASGSRRAQSEPAVRNFLTHYERYAATIGPVVAFLQGRRPGLAGRILSRNYLPEWTRFDVLKNLQAAHGGADPLSVLGPDPAFNARYLASLYIDDLTDVVRTGIDPDFNLARYAERLAVSAPSFTPLRRALETASPGLIDAMIDDIAEKLYARFRPGLLALTVPFPGNLYGALRIARRIRHCSGGRTRIALGGGYVSTELRGLSDAAVFNYVDYVVLDDGLQTLLTLAQGAEPACADTFVRRRGKVISAGAGRNNGSPGPVVPSYRGLEPSRYVSICEVPNPMHRMWSDGWWNKLMLARGCYWHKCSFCDTKLDYIGAFKPLPVGFSVDAISRIIRETGRRNFHFVDEAAPPALLEELARQLIRRRMKIRWWTNIRFEKAFTPRLAGLLARSGCVAVTGGLEAVTDRMLTAMNKGTSLKQAVAALKSFSGAGIMVHAYLMYGFPGQGRQETVDALEIVRQLFLAGCLQSAYWHRFALTVYSEVYRESRKFGIRLLETQFKGFARNEAAYAERGQSDLEMTGAGLRAALYNYVHGVGLEEPVGNWFAGPMPLPRVGAIVDNA